MFEEDIPIFCGRSDVFVVRCVTGRIAVVGVDSARALTTSSSAVFIIRNATSTLEDVVGPTLAFSVAAPRRGPSAQPTPRSRDVRPVAQPQGHSWRDGFWFPPAKRGGRGC